MALSRGLGLPTTFYFALWRVRQSNSQTRTCSHFTTTRSHGVLLVSLGTLTRNVHISDDNVLSLSQTFRLVLFTTVFTAPMGRRQIPFEIGTHLTGRALCPTAPGGAGERR